MKIKKYKVYSVLLVMLTAITVMSGYINTVAKEMGNRVVRVAFPIRKGITDYDENCKRSGYTYEYLEEIAQYTGWEYEFVEVDEANEDSWIKLMEQLENGEIDLMGAMVYNEDIENTYDYTSYS